jgi:dipeptide/tripeptide permease
MFYLGLFLIVIGTGLPEGHVSVIVGKLYATATAGASRVLDLSTWASTSARSSRRWSAVPRPESMALGLRRGGVGMTLGVIQYVLGGAISARRNPRRHAGRARDAGGAGQIAADPVRVC